MARRRGEYLNHSVFREVTKPRTLPLNSPILQRKEGYREILRVWLMFDLAAKLCWNALDRDQYHAGKRDVATLYEYWVFFKLLDVVKSVFQIEPKAIDKLIKATSDGMGLQLQQGRHLALGGSCRVNGRNLTVEFHYNRTFNNSSFPDKGSWTQSMRPDYTLTLRPREFSQDEAERQELIVHIHFDAKYKVDGLRYLIIRADWASYTGDVMGARYLLLHGEDDSRNARLWKIVGESPKMMTKQKLLDLDYPLPSVVSILSV